MRGLMYTTQCTKSHIYLYFLEYVQEIFGIEQDKEGLDLLRIIDTKKVTAIVAANVRKPVNHIYLGKLQKICIHALTDKTMEEDRIVSAAFVDLYWAQNRGSSSYRNSGSTVYILPKNAGKPLALAMGMDRRCRDFA